jgi:ribosomal protein L28
MGKICQICKKGKFKVVKRKKLRGKFNPVKVKRQKPNLQWFKLPSGKRILVCAKCLKTLTKTLNRK